MGPTSPLERHQAWRVRKTGKKQHVPREPDPSPPPGTDAKEELQFCVKVSTHPTHRCKLYTHSIRGSQTQNSSHCSQQDTQVAELYQTNDLSGNERSNGRSKRKVAQGTFITLPWAMEPRALALYQINSRKKNTPKSASFLWSLSLSLQNKQKQSFCGQSVPSSLPLVLRRCCCSWLVEVSICVFYKSKNE